MTRKCIALLMAAAVPALTLTSEGHAEDANAAARATVESAVSADAPYGLNVTLFDRTLSMNVPAGFVPAFRQTDGRFFIMEFVPRGESVTAWTEMLTVTAIAGGGSLPQTTREIVTMMFGSSKGCDDGYTLTEAGEQVVGEGLLTASTVLRRSAGQAVARPACQTV
jgi:hypothetical protein